ncbi:MAG: AAA family ATPase [Nitrososphaerota archaeon]
MPRAYLVAGTPGVGKSTVAPALASRLGAAVLEVRELADPGEFEVQASKLSARAGSWIRRKGQDAVIATHIVFKPRGVSLLGAVVLRRNPVRLIVELEERGYRLEKVLENVEAELLGVVYLEALRKLGRGKVFQFDTTDRSVDEVVELTYKALRGGLAGEEIDWVSRLEREGGLAELLSRLSARGMQG